MLHAKFQDLRTSGYEIVLKVFIIYVHGGNLGHVTCTICINFGSPIQRMLHIKYGFDSLSGFREEDI